MMPRRPRAGLPREQIRGTFRRIQGTVIKPDELSVARTSVVIEREPGEARRRILSMSAALLVRDRLVLGVLLAIAAVARLPGLAGRGTFDADQGHDMLVLLHFTRDGIFPLLGPPTSIGDFHHGAFYYLLLAPVAAISNSNPLAVVTAVALMGIAAVAVTWWLARSIGGRLAGLVAGLLLAISPAAIDESTFLWNPNPIPLFAAIALAAAWRAHLTGRARWWVVALGSAGAVFQLHVLGVVFLPPIAALLVDEVRRARRRGDAAAVRRLVAAGLAGLAVIALLFVPLAIHELQTSFSETRRAFAYFTGGSGGGAALDPVQRLFFTLLRIVGWPFVGLVTETAVAASLVLAIVAALATWGVVTTRGERSLAIRWLAGTVAWSAIALSVLAPSLQTVVAGLPNDHYHAFLDPVVVILASVTGIAMASPAAGPRPRVDVTARALLAIALVAVVGLEVSRWPRAADPNGGWPTMQAAGARIVETTGQDPVALVGIPGFKSPDAIGFPIVYAGGALADDPSSAGFIVVPCDRLFESVVGADCGGPAEDRQMRYLAAGGHPLPTLVARFDASPRTAISIYRP
jgi:4-amino-4-deoxy-L-arabinose transferase-like glycosyltransferase